MDVLCLTDTVGPVDRLLLDKWVPVRLFEDDVVRNIQIQSSVALHKTKGLVSVMVSEINARAGRG